MNIRSARVRRGAARRTVAIITGAAKGIGAGIARVLRAEGADIVIADLDADAAQALAAELDAGGGHVLTVRTDVTSRDELQALVAAALARWGRIDVLAANAGIYPHIPLAELDPADFDALMAINVNGAVSRSKPA